MIVFVGIRGGLHICFQTLSLISKFKVGVAHKRNMPRTEIGSTVLLGSYVLYINLYDV